MGVPKFYRWLSERYPNINHAVNQALKPDFDALYLDMNGIIHNCSHPEGGGGEGTIHEGVKVRSEAQLFGDIFKYIDKLFKLVRPRRLLYMAIDGVAPRAKMNQQRQRRFRSAMDAQQQREIDAAKMGTSSLDDEHRFDSNAITPGTAFMAHISTALRFFVRRKLSEDVSWQRCQVIFSGAEVPGEGEHKIMQYIRNQKMQPNYDPNIKHCLYGLDADLVMLGLVSHEPNFALLREEVVFGGGGGGKGGKGGSKPSRGALKKFDEFQFLHLSVLRTYLSLEFSPIASSLSFPFDLERVIDDWVFLCMLVGNDFLPHLPTLDIGEGGLDSLFALYRRLLPELGGYLTHHGELAVTRVERIFAELALLENEVFTQRIRDAEKEDKRRRRDARNSGAGRHYRGVTEIEPMDEFPSAEGEEETASTLYYHADGKTIDFQTKYYRDKFPDFFGMPGPSSSPRLPSPAPSESDSSPSPSPSPLGLPPPALNTTSSPIKPTQNAVVNGGSSDFLLVPFSSSSSSSSASSSSSSSSSSSLSSSPSSLSSDGMVGRRHLVQCYINGLEWVLQYYYQGCCSWKWFFPYRYSPLASDMKDLSVFVPAQFEVGLPFRPMEQLLGVLPPQSAKLLPSCFRPLMSSEASPIVDFYPTSFDIDMNGKRSSWEGIALIPFIDEHRLLSAIRSIDLERQLTAGEKLRNERVGEDILFVYDEACVDTVASPVSFLSDLKQCHSRATPFNLPPIPIISDEERLRVADELARLDNLASSAQPQRNAVVVEDDVFLRSPMYNPKLSGKFVPIVPKGAVLPAPGYPNLLALPITAHLEKLAINVFGSESRKDTLALTIKNDSTTLMPDLSRVVGTTVYVHYPFLREAIVTGVLDGSTSTRWTTDGAASPFTKDDTQRFTTDIHLHRTRCLTTRGIELGETRALLVVRVFIGMRRLYDGSIRKQFDATETTVPLSLVVFRNFAPDPRYIEKPPPTLADAFPLLSTVVYIGPRYYGSLATIVGYSQPSTSASSSSSSSGHSSGFPTLSVQLSVYPVAIEKDFSHRIEQQSRLQYYPAYMVAKHLQLHPLVLSKLCSSIFVMPGNVDVGLRLKYSKQALQVPDFARRVDNSWNNNSVAYVQQQQQQLQQANGVSGGSNGEVEEYDAGAGQWEYSEKSIALIQAYKKRFPAFFDVLNGQPDTFKFNAEDFNLFPTKPPREAVVETLSVMTSWLESAGISHLLLQPCSSSVMAERGARAIEAESAKIQAVYASMKQQLTLDSVPVFHVYKASPSVPWSPTERQDTVLGDRVISLRSDGGAPFGLRGTVVAVHHRCFCEVVFDEPFMQGTTLHRKLANNFRGQTLPITALLNLSKPIILTPKTIQDDVEDSARNQGPLSKLKPSNNATVLSASASPVSAVSSASTVASSSSSSSSSTTATTTTSSSASDATPAPLIPSASPSASPSVPSSSFSVSSPADLEALLKLHLGISSSLSSPSSSLSSQQQPQPPQPSPTSASPTLGASIQPPSGPSPLTSSTPASAASSFSMPAVPSSSPDLSVLGLTSATGVDGVDDLTLRKLAKAKSKQSAALYQSFAAAGSVTAGATTLLGASAAMGMPPAPAAGSATAGDNTLLGTSAGMGMAAPAPTTAAAAAAAVAAHAAGAVGGAYMPQPPYPHPLYPYNPFATPQVPFPSHHHHHHHHFNQLHRLYAMSAASAYPSPFYMSASGPLNSPPPPAAAVAAAANQPFVPPNAPSHPTTQPKWRPKQPSQQP